MLIHKNKANITQDEDKQELRFASRRSQFLVSFGELDSICTWLFYSINTEALYGYLVLVPGSASGVRFQKFQGGDDSSVGWFPELG
jgi:hypothetical protein